MKLFYKFLLIALLLAFTECLQLTSHKKGPGPSGPQSHKNRPYFGPHYRSHRSEEYVQEIKSENLKKIEQFNNNNKKRLRAGPGGSTVTGGNSFVMGETKFIEFTEEEFVKLFTGFKDPNSQGAGHKKAQTIPRESHKEAHESESSKIFSRHFLGKIDLTLAHNMQQMQSHYKQTTLQNSAQQQHQKNIWQFDDPYQIDDDYLSSIYGSVNDDHNYGWDWQNFDNNYYNDFGDDKDNYWSDWEDDHWGYDKEDKGWDYNDGSDDSWWGTDEGWDNTNEDSWWNDWSNQEKENQDNQNWWNDDSWGNQNDDDRGNQEDNDQGNQDDDWGNEDNDWGNEDDVPTPPKPDPKPNPPPTPSGDRAIAAYPTDAMQVNWILKNATTHVKEQGECGSCWTFSTIGIIESYFIITGATRMDLSEQQLVDCEKQGGAGCEGGWPPIALQYVTNNGLVAQDKYPYRGVQQKCAHPTGPHKIPKSHHAVGRSQIESALRKGPVTAAVYVDDGFQFYKQGIFDRCIKEQANHAIVIVGFTKDFWIIRNSWGKDWGEDGHIRLKRDQNNKNACSIEDHVYAIDY